MPSYTGATARYYELLGIPPGNYLLLRRLIHAHVTAIFFTDGFAAAQPLGPTKINLSPREHTRCPSASVAPPPVLDT